MVGLRSALEIEVSLPFLAGPEDASLPGTAVPHHNLTEPRIFGEVRPIESLADYGFCARSSHSPRTLSINSIPLGPKFFFLL